LFFCIQNIRRLIYIPFFFFSITYRYQAVQEITKIPGIFHTVLFDKAVIGENMRIDCYFTHQGCQESEFSGRDAMVIDVLRATSSIITALEAGAKAVIPVSEISAALELAALLPGAILSGEREGERLEGFSLGNSPSEFKREIIAGRVIISCTTNGTAAIVKAAAAERIWLAALLNARAAANKLFIEATRDLALLCSGTYGQPSLDDILAAGAILSHLSHFTSLELNDSALIALRLYESCAPIGMSQALKLSAHAQKLICYNHAADVEYCCRENISGVVPWLNKIDGRIYG
jgi:2-phosphosulfolactate phosphatase